MITKTEDLAGSFEIFKIVIPAIILIVSEVATTTLGSFQAGPLSCPNWNLEINMYVINKE